MQINKIIVDKKPQICADCLFCCQFYEPIHDDYWYQCIVSGKTIGVCEKRPTIKSCDIFEEQK